MSGETRPRHRTVRDRASTLFAAVAGSLAIGIAAVAFTAESPGEVVILEVETVALSTMPMSVAIPSYRKASRCRSSRSATVHGLSPVTLRTGWRSHPIDTGQANCTDLLAKPN